MTKSLEFRSFNVLKKKLFSKLLLFAFFFEVGNNQGS